MPLSVLDVDDAQAAELYARALVLVRPDRHVAWRGNDEPAASMDLIDRVRGAHLMPALARSVMTPAPPALIHMALAIGPGAHESGAA
jgi:hypothetical protein